MARTRDAYVHWKEVLQKWSEDNSREQVHLDDLLGLLSENPDEWNGGKGSFLTKMMNVLGWETKKSRRNGRIYYRANPNPRPQPKVEATVPPPVKQAIQKPNQDLEEIFEQIRGLVAAPTPDPKILEEVKALRERVSEAENKTAILTEDLNKKIEALSQLKLQVQDLKTQPKEKPEQPPKQSNEGSLAQRAHELQKINREQANEIKYLETKNSNLQRQIEILESSVAAKPGETLNSGAKPKSVRDLLSWFGLDLEKSRIIASGRNLNHDVEIEIVGEKLIRFVTLPGEAERRSYNELDLSEDAQSILNVLFPCRVYYQTLTSSSIVYACELLGKPLRLV